MHLKKILYLKQLLKNLHSSSIHPVLSRTDTPTAKISASGRRSEVYCYKSSCTRKAMANTKCERLIVTKPSHK